MNHHFYLTDASLFYLKNLEGIILIVLDISFITQSFSDVYLQTPSVGVIFAAILAALLLLLSGFASETLLAYQDVATGL